MVDRNQNSKLIPERLLSNIKRGNSVLFLGADLSLGYPNAPPSRPELARTLASQFGLPQSRPWPETAQEYLAKFPGDRQGLVSFITQQCRDPNTIAGRLHAAIAQAGFRAIVSAWYDDLLEETLRSAGYRVNRVVHDAELAYADEGEREVILIKLFGSLSDVTSLVLDVWDHEELMDRLSRKLELVTAFCSLRPPLFVGFDLTDRLPMRLYVRASTNISRDMRRAYAVWPDSIEGMKAKWREKNVEILQSDATAFLEALASQVPVIASKGTDRSKVERPPYKFLDYYGPEDEAIFCGRDTEIQILTRLVLSHRYFTLFGPSGAGKTSMLLAGIVPNLADEDYHHVYVRLLDDPLPSLRKAVAARAGSDDWQKGEDLRDFLTHFLAPEDRLVVVLDQFEELFLRVGSGSREIFFRQLSESLENPERDVRVIFGLREDYLARLYEARPYLEEVFNHSYRLGPMDRGHARVAVTEPAARVGVKVEPILVDTLVGHEGGALSSADEVYGAAVGRARGDLVEANGHVPPAALQIVLDRLYREALPTDHDPKSPPPMGVILTLESYLSIRYSLGEGAQELNGAHAILASYLEDGLARLNEVHGEGNEPIGADPLLAREILKVMVTSQVTKAALSEDEMLEYLDQARVIQWEDETDRRSVQKARLGLERVRLLRGFDRGGEAIYELAHDHLAAGIATWISEEEMHSRVVRELLRRELDNYRHARLLIPPDALRIIHEQHESFKRLDQEELELVLRSALAEGYEVSYWFERASARGIPAYEIALEGLNAEGYRERAAAVSTLAELGMHFINEIILLLDDPYPQVRAATLQALETLRPSGEWRKHLVHECYVPAGLFLLGADSGRENERPAHEIDLDAFYIGKFPVTNADWWRYMQDSNRDFEIPPNKEDHPVVDVTWFDARHYADWASMRLLSEAEWEKAASWDEMVQGDGKRMGQASKREYPWGNEFDAGKCNTQISNINATTPVGRYSPSGDSSYGCADMVGNVWEWTNSIEKSYPYRADDGPEKSTSTAPRVMRGGSFGYDASIARCVTRRPGDPSVHYESLGFRLGWSPLSHQRSKKQVEKSVTVSPDSDEQSS